ncbi:MAG TPA: cytochrome oxidase small assembly protein [Casimicrobiaceae bacterium]|jgi:K+-sensing histidine kinase KdpD
MDAPTPRRDDPAVRASIRRTGWILASIAVIFFLGVLASRLIGDTSLAMTVIGVSVFSFLLFGIGRHLKR